MRLAKGIHVVTGAAGGIGLATAEALAAAGATIALVDRDTQPLAGHTVLRDAAIGTFALDVTDESELRALAGTLARHGDVAGLVNAAGVFQTGTARDVTGAEWDRVIDVNLKGTFLVCQALLPLLERGGGGAIVNLASISGRTKSIFAAPNYAASKAGVIGLTMTLAVQHAPRGVRVNCVAPGLIDTPMLSVYGPDQRAQAVAGVPAGRMGTAAEVADCIVFLLSERSSYVTGQTLNVNGGAFMQ